MGVHRDSINVEKVRKFANTFSWMGKMWEVERKSEKMVRISLKLKLRPFNLALNFSTNQTSENGDS